MSSTCSLFLFEMEEIHVGSPQSPRWRRKDGGSSVEKAPSECKTENRTAGQYGMKGDAVPYPCVSSAPVPLGTSAPIDIKFVSDSQKRRALQVAQQLPHTFVPPHLLNTELNLDWLLVEQGLSPTAGLKKEKLRVRDAVLRSTGYQE